MRVRWTATAVAEVEGILAYIAADNPNAATTVAHEIELAVLRIKEHPQFATIVYQGDVRAVLVGGFNYRIFYVATGRDVEMEPLRRGNLIAIGAQRTRSGGIRHG